MEQSKPKLETKSFPEARVQSIGRSELGRPLVVHQIGEGNAHFRVLVLAGQHGDERIARQAALKLIDSIKSSMVDLSDIFISIIPDCNPDGAASNTRMNAKGIDLNRDHQRLQSTEIQALHAFVRSFKPHLIEDAHNYQPRRRHLLSRNLIMDHDVFIDVPSHPAAPLLTNEEDFHSMLTSVQSDLRSKGFTCDRYVLLRQSGRVRHSTLDLRDARNGLSLRYSCFVALIEGKTSHKKNRENGEDRIVNAEHDAMISIIRWGQKHSDLFSISSSSSPGHYRSDNRSFPSRIPIRFRYESFSETLEMTFVNSVSGKREMARLEHFASKPRITETVQLPLAYAVMKEKIGVIEILQRHGFGFTRSRSKDEKEVEAFKLTPPEKNNVTIRTGKPKKLSRRFALSAVRCRRSLYGYVIFPSSNQEGGIALALFLEPNSKYFLGRYEDLGLDAISGESPIMRVIG